MDFRASLIIVLVILLILMLMGYYLTWNCDSAETKEGFDTYRNHDYWAADHYNKKGCYNVDCLDEAETTAKYKWKEQDPSGRNIYDKYYETVSRNRLNSGDPEYVEREFETDNSVYDTKFSTISGNDYAVYNIASMADKHPVTTVAVGNVLHLSQKNY
jgi:hypothetical protein